MKNLTVEVVINEITGDIKTAIDSHGMNFMERVGALEHVKRIMFNEDIETIQKHDSRESLFKEKPLIQDSPKFNTPHPSDPPKYDA